MSEPFRRLARTGQIPRVNTTAGTETRVPDDAPISGVFDTVVGGDDLDWFVHVRPTDSTPDRTADEPLTG